MEPEPSSYKRRLKILPYDIIEQMAEAEVNPEKVNQPKPLLSKDSNCFYDLKYVRYSSNTLLGVVRENRQRKNEIYGKINISLDKKIQTIVDIFSTVLAWYPMMARNFIDDMFDTALPYLAAEEERLKKVRYRVEKSDKDQ